MAELKYQEKQYLEKLTGMQGGYVFDFSNRTFRDFIFDTVRIDIDEKRFYKNGESKAKRFRVFLEMESDHNVGVVIKELCDYWLMKVKMGEFKKNPANEELYKECLKLADKLKSGAVVENMEAIQPNVDDADFKKFSESIKDCIERNQPETGLDRLHTFLTRYIRELCQKHKIEIKKDLPLHSIFGMYLKYLTGNNLIDSEMTVRILKSSISVMEAFNSVRNEKSFAHDNPILNYDESILIFNAVSNVLKFIEKIEHRIEAEGTPDLVDWENWSV